MKAASKHCFFLKKKPQKKLLIPLTALVESPVAQINKNFLLPRAGRRFFKNEVLASCFC